MISPGRLKSIATTVFYNLGPIIAVLVLWEVSVRTGLIRAFFLPPVTDVFAQLWESISSGQLPSAFLVTTKRMLIGYAIGAGSAVVFGLLIGVFRPLRNFFYPIVAAVYPLPKIAMLSIFIVIFGVGDPPIIASVAISSFFPVLLNTLTGLRSIDPILIKAAEDLGANRFQVTTKVVLPGSLPMIFTGLRQSSAVALIVVVAVEMYIGQSGVGYLLSWATEFFKINLLYANLFAIGIFGILVFRLVDFIEYIALPWARER
ncbi:MAG TPA: ABC transporter permease [Xanthobacteraceae bacterium]|nr:ABC transporter permease [Xanthobacteraceae bacterium]